MVLEQDQITELVDEYIIKGNENLEEYKFKKLKPDQSLKMLSPYLSQDEIDVLLGIAEENEENDDDKMVDICIENISIEFSKEIILLANRLGASSAIMHFRNNK